ncbi:MAG: FAD-binding oxidoreductase [Rickettsiales bacterium]|jgi:decaprenylphospho-beta-D-ribofuranose 2-oxidase|nr:FAD-binding oxidoreductase [Rickettsiales bacterium]
MNTKQERLHGWGHTPVVDSLSWRPEKGRELRELVKNAASPTLLARGMGRSYGDASLQPAGVIRTERFDHLIEFDAELGILRAQAGLTLADVMDFAVPRGFLPPVLPGTRYVTLGGAFACNVHGKNHFALGDFAEHVLSIRLLLADGRSVECSPQEHSDLFWATAGGMGMTGVIEELTLRLRPINSISLRAIHYRVDSIHDMIAAFEQYRSKSDYMIGWIDHMAKGDLLGRGVFEAASHVAFADGGKPLSEYRPLKQKKNIPTFAPNWLLNRYSMAIYNRLRFRRYSYQRQSENTDFNGFFHPLDGLGSWYKLYGKRGFFQYQCLIPETANVAQNIQRFLEMLHEEKLFSYLAVIKYHRDGLGMLTFPLKGYSIALDFPNTKRVRDFLPQLSRWIAERGGRVYLAKDALLTPEQFQHMYSTHAGVWQDVLRDIDPDGRFTSLMSDRLNWKPWRSSAL